MMAQIELDAIKSCNSQAIDQFYENNLRSIVTLDTPSPSLSLKTVSSTRSIDLYIPDNDDGSTASDSDVDDLNHDPISKRNEILKYQTDGQCSSSLSNAVVKNDNNVIVVSNSDTEPSASRIESIAIQNSTDITFGNKTFYNGPVTIKQFLIDEKNNKWTPRANEKNSQLENGIINNGFSGSQNNVSSNEPNVNKEKENLDNCSQYLRIKSFTLTKNHFIVSLITILCALVGIAALLVFLSNADRISNEVRTGSDLLPGKVLRLISRDEWLAQPPNNELDNLKLPVKRIIITHTATESCETQAACTLRARLMQTFHMESKNWDDIGYNFMIGGDGAVYEGRGWDKQGAHTKGYNVGSIGIAYIGTFNKKLPSDKQLTAGFLLFAEGVKFKKLTPDFKIYAHRQLIASESPGAAFFELIKTWQHWTEELPM